MAVPHAAVTSSRFSRAIAMSPRGLHGLLAREDNKLEAALSFTPYFLSFAPERSFFENILNVF